MLMDMQLRSTFSTSRMPYSKEYIHQDSKSSMNAPLDIVLGRLSILWLCAVNVPTYHNSSIEIAMKYL